MSRRRRSRTSRPSSPPLSPTASEADNSAQLKLVEPKPEIRYASTDDDVIAIHRFLMIVAKPALRCPINVVKSLNEIIRVTKEEAAIMVMHGDVLVGTMGLIRPVWWYGDAAFLTDRWHFVLPQFMHTPTAKALMDEAKEIAEMAGLEFIHQGKIRGEKNGMHRMMPTAFIPESAKMAAGG